MKRVLALVVAMLFVFSFAACGNEDTGENPNRDNDNMNTALSWWEGEWYGYWVAENAGGKYAEWKGGKWDCYAVIDVDSDGNAIMYIWDDEIDVATAEIKIELDGGITPMGSANSIGGNAFAEPLDYADWTIMPTYDGYEDYYGNVKYDDYMEIEGLVDTDDAYLRYTVVLRPWGILWSDMPSEDRSPFYDNWYLHNDFYQKSSLLDALADTIFEGEYSWVHSALGGGLSGGDSVKEDSSGGEPGSSNAASGSGDVIILDLTNAELKATWNSFQDSFKEWSEITYDQVVALFGAPGIVNREGDGFIDYRWYASDDGSLTVQFKKPSGEFARSSMNQYGRPD